MPCSTIGINIFFFLFFQRNNTNHFSTPITEFESDCFLFSFVFFNRYGYMFFCRLEWCLILNRVRISYSNHLRIFFSILFLYSSFFAWKMWSDCVKCKLVSLIEIQCHINVYEIPLTSTRVTVIHFVCVISVRRKNKESSKELKMSNFNETNWMNARCFSLFLLSIRLLKWDWLLKMVTVCLSQQVGRILSKS